MKILVIGGSGFIGTGLAGALVKCGHEVSIFDNRLSHAWPGSACRGDVRDVDALVKASRGVEVIYNLAAEHKDDISPVSLYYDVNAGGAKNVAAAAEQNGVKKIVFTSSVAVYGLNKRNPDESSQAEPFNHYGRSKLQAEKILEDWAARGPDRSLSIVRPAVIFGEGNRGNVYNLIKQIQSGRFMMVGRGMNCKSMGYVENLTGFLGHLLNAGPGKRLFNFADKPDLSVQELVGIIRAELGIKERMAALPFYVGLLGGVFFDVIGFFTGKKFPVSSIRIRKFCAETTVSTEALEATGFKPPHTLEDGLKKMIASLKKSPDIEIPSRMPPVFDRGGHSDRP